MRKHGEFGRVLCIKKSRQAVCDWQIIVINIQGGGAEPVGDGKSDIIGLNHFFGLKCYIYYMRWLDTY